MAGVPGNDPLRLQGFRDRIPWSGGRPVPGPGKLPSDRRLVPLRGFPLNGKGEATWAIARPQVQESAHDSDQFRNAVER